MPNPRNSAAPTSICSSSSISTPTFATAPLCATSATTLDVTFTASGSYSATNSFTVQLSDAAGSFTAPVSTVAAANNSNAAQTLTLPIPASTPSGTGYRIRVLASDPATTSTGTSAALTIVSSPTVSITPAANQAYVAGNPGTTLTATESFAAGTTRAWQVASAAAGPFTNITPAQTGPTYTPTFGAAGTYFVRVESTFAGCGAVPSGNVVQVDVAAPAPVATLAVTAGTLAAFLTAEGTPSPARSYTLTGSNLTANATVTPPTGYEVSSTSATAGFAASLSLTPAQVAAPGLLIYVRLAGTAAGVYGTQSTPVPVANASPGATPREVDVKGTVLAAEPTAQPGVSVANVAISQADVTVTGGNGTTQLVVIRLASTAPAAPADAATYFANPTFGAGAVTGPNNFVAFLGATGTTTFAVGNLAGNTEYAVDSYAFSGASGLENYLTATPGTFVFTTLPLPAATYTWSGLGGNANWTTAANWVPLRTTALSNDVLVFDGSVTAAPAVTLDFPMPQTVAQVHFTQGVAATFNNTGNRKLSFDGGVAGPDFDVQAGTSLRVVTETDNAASNALVLELTANETALVAGTLTLDGSSASSGTGHARLVATVPNATSIEFVANSRFVAGPNFSGNAFGSASTALNSVVFRSGAVYEQQGGSNPFGAPSPNSVTEFEPGSFYKFTAGSGGPSYSGRTYANFEINSVSNGLTLGGAASNGLFRVKGDFLLTSSVGTVKPNSNNVELNGNLVVNGGSLSFNGGSASVVRFKGTAAQSISGTAAAGVVFENGMEVDNPAGLTVAHPTQVLGAFTLADGLVTTAANGAVATLLLGPGATASAGSATAFVRGPLSRQTNPVAPPTVATVPFPIGKGAFYRPLTLEIAGQTTASTYTAEQVEGNPGQTPLASSNGLGTAPLRRVSAIRSFTLTSSNTSSGNATGNVTLSFGAGDFVNDPGDAGLVVAARNAIFPAWLNLSRSASTGTASGPGGASVNGTLTSATISDLANSATFALGATNDNNTFGAAVNPLPVELTSISAQRQPDQRVTVRWATASERNSAYFEVQRSADGREFVGVAKATARGTSSSPTAYVATDAKAPAGRLYYRLHQVDLDGTAAFSPIVTVEGDGSAAKFTLYPNPAHASIYVPTEVAGAYRILNQLGQPLLHGTAEAGTANVATGALAPGLYFLELQTPAGRTVQKFEKQ